MVIFKPLLSFKKPKIIFENGNSKVDLSVLWCNTQLTDLKLIKAPVLRQQSCCNEGLTGSIPYALNISRRKVKKKLLKNAIINNGSAKIRQKREIKSNQWALAMNCYCEALFVHFTRWNIWGNWLIHLLSEQTKNKTFTHIPTQTWLT